MHDNILRTCIPRVAWSQLDGNWKLEDNVDEFPRFFNAISSFMQKDALKFFPDRNLVNKIRLIFCPLPIFGFINCSIDKIILVILAN
jgi:hypothetical protein